MAVLLRLSRLSPAAIAAVAIVNSWFLTLGRATHELQDGDAFSLIQLPPPEHSEEAAHPHLLSSLSFRKRSGAYSTHHVVKAVEASAIPGGSKITITTHDLNLSKIIQGIKMPMPAVTGSLIPGPAALSAGVGGIPIVRNLSSMFVGGNITTIGNTTWMTYTNSSGMTMLGARQPVDLIPVWEVKQAISDAVEEGIRKAEEAAAGNNTKATMEDIKKAVNAEVFKSWHSIQQTMKANRFKRKAWSSLPHGGFIHFFKSVGWLDWFLFSIFIVVFIMQHYHVLNWPSTRTFHGVALLIWVVLAGLYNFVVFQRLGPTAGILWLNGYVLELVFLIENVLVCHIILQAFRTPKWVNEKALFIVVISRVVYQMVFYMGLAELVFRGQALPYILGLWLLYVAFQSAMDDEDANFDIMDTRVVYLARATFGDRLSLTKEDGGSLFVTRENKTRLSLVGLMVFCLILVDFLLHVDVALTKIEELQGNAFLCFSSAAAASFCMPELIFVTRDLFRKFPGLKYGISCVLVYIAFQMLLHQIWWPPISLDLIIWVSLLVLSAALPVSSAGWRRGSSRAVDTGTQATLTVSEKPAAQAPPAQAPAQAPASGSAQ